MRLLIFDYNNILYRSIFVHKDLSYDGVFTGGVYGFINQFCNALLQYSPDKIIVCSDAPPYLRKKLYPQYKGDRKHDDGFFELVGQSKKLCSEFFSLINLQEWSVPGYEADDCIAWLCQEYQEICIISNDDDLYQLLRPGITIWKGIKKGEYTLDTFVAEFPSLSPDLWTLFCGMKGSHNAVPGLKGIGPKTAIKILQDENKFKEIYEKNKDQLSLYISLCTIPLTSEVEFPEIQDCRMRELPMLKFLSSLGIEQSILMKNAFKKLI